jgi:hypothetical protein
LEFSLKIQKPPAFCNFTAGQEFTAAVWILYSKFESETYFSGSRDKTLQPGSIEYVLYFNVGNLNNVYFCGVVIDALLSYFVKSKVIRASVVLVLALTVSWIIEQNDPADMIGSVLGFLLYALYNFTAVELRRTS